MANGCEAIWVPPKLMLPCWMITKNNITTNEEQPVQRYNLRQVLWASWGGQVACLLSNELGGATPASFSTVHFSVSGRSLSLLDKSRSPSRFVHDGEESTSARSGSVRSEDIHSLECRVGHVRESIVDHHDILVWSEMGM